MLDRNITWVQKVNEVRKICAGCSLPVDVEKDASPFGIDGVLELGSILFEKTGDVYDVDFEINLKYSTSKERWEDLLKRLSDLAQKLDTNIYTLSGWERVDDDSKLIYTGVVIIKGMINSDLLS